MAELRPHFSNEVRGDAMHLGERVRSGVDAMAVLTWADPTTSG